MRREKGITSSPKYKDKKRSKSRSRSFIITILTIGLLVEIVVVLLTSPFFHIKQITAAQNNTVSDSDIISAANIQPETNIFRLHVKSVIANIESNPVIESVVLHRKLPSELIICVTEREVYSILEASGKFIQLDKSLVPFRIAKEKPKDFPVIKYTPPKKVILGKTITDPIIEASQKCIILSNSASPFKIDEITVDQNKELCLNIDDGYKIIIGRPINLEEKIDIASQVLIQIPRFRKNGEYIDVTAPEAPAVKYKK